MPIKAEKQLYFRITAHGMLSAQHHCARLARDMRDLAEARPKHRSFVT